MLYFDCSILTPGQNLAIMIQNCMLLQSLALLFVLQSNLKSFWGPLQYHKWTLMGGLSIHRLKLPEDIFLGEEQKLEASQKEDPVSLYALPLLLYCNLPYLISLQKAEKQNGLWTTKFLQNLLCIHSQKLGQRVLCHAVIHFQMKL